MPTLSFLTIINKEKKPVRSKTRTSTSGSLLMPILSGRKTVITNARIAEWNIGYLSLLVS